MTISDIRTYLVRPRWGFVEIETDDGLIGWGEPVLREKPPPYAPVSRR